MLPPVPQQGLQWRAPQQVCPPRVGPMWSKGSVVGVSPKKDATFDIVLRCNVYIYIYIIYMSNIYIYIYIYGNFCKIHQGPFRIEHSMRNRSWGISEYPVFGQTLQCAMLEALYQETFQSVKATWQWKLPLGSEYVSIWPPNGNVNIDKYIQLWLYNPWIAGYPISRQTLISVARIQWCSLFGSQCLLHRRGPRYF